MTRAINHVSEQWGRKGRREKTKELLEQYGKIPNELITSYSNEVWGSHESRWWITPVFLWCLPYLILMLQCASTSTYWIQKPFKSAYFLSQLNHFESKSTSCLKTRLSTKKHHNPMAWHTTSNALKIWNLSLFIL